MRYFVPLAALLSGCCQCAPVAAASECLDPPRIDGWRYSHRAYHALAGALIGWADTKILHAAAPSWCRRHPFLAELVAEAPVVGAAVGKEAIDHRYGSETNSHSLGDIAVTSAGGVFGIAVAIRF